MNKLKILLCAVVFSVCCSTSYAAKKVDCKIPNSLKILLEEIGGDENTELAGLILSDPDAIEEYMNLSKNDLKELRRNPAALRIMLKIPNINNGFEKWFDDDITPAELDEMWKDKLVRKSIENKLRGGGKKHEWCMVCMAPALKASGIKLKEILTWTTDVTKVTWTIPDYKLDINGNEIRDEDNKMDNFGENGQHKKDDDNPDAQVGSTRFHNELKKIVDKLAQASPDKKARVAQFKKDIQAHLERWEVPNREKIFKDIWLP